LGRLAREKSPKVSVLEAESSLRRNDSINFVEKVKTLPLTLSSGIRFDEAFETGIR